MITSVVYLLVRGLLGWLAVLSRAQASKDAELLVLRHENAVLATQNNLSEAYRDAGHPGEAIALLESTVAMAEKIQSADHPDLLNYRYNLATAYLEDGKTQKGSLLLRAAVADAERVHGGEHRIAVRARHRLAAALAGELPDSSSQSSAYET